MEKIIISLIVLSLMIGPGMALNVTDEAYIEGLVDGYALGALNVLGQRDPATEAQFNENITALNQWLDSINYTGEKWAPLQHVAGAQNYSLPRIFAEGDDWYKTGA